MAYPGHRFALMLFVSVIVLWLGVMLLVMRQSELPPEANGTMIAVFEPGVTSEAAFAAITQAGARPVRDTAFAFIWVVSGDEAGLAGALKAEGAIGIYRELPISPTLAGCVAVIDQRITAYTGM